MRRIVVGRMLTAVVVAVGLTLAGGPVAAAHGGRARALTCTGGEIPSGSYSSITVKGACQVAAGAVIKVSGGITVWPGATLDAQSSPSTITVGKGVLALKGSFLGLGCQPAALMGNSAHPCVDADGNPIEDPSVFSTITVKGSIIAARPAVVLINGLTVGGDVTVVGGGSPVIPWSVKNNTIKGNLHVSHVTTNWFGALFNKVGKNLTLWNIVLVEDHPGAAGVVYVVQNQIRRNLICKGLPGVSGGFVPGAVNTVGGKALGQCAGLAG